MHYYSSPVTHSGAGVAGQAPEGRGTPRRALACRIALTLSSDEVLHGFSVDLSRAGIGIAVPKRVATGQDCNFTLSFFANGRSHRLSACGQIVSCVCSGMDGFRIGIKFTHLDAAAQEILDHVLQ